MFGTDGIRGRANSSPITPFDVLKIALSTGAYFTQKLITPKTHRFTIVIGKDTRLSCYMIEAALQSGFLSIGADVILLGPLPTPAVAYLVQSLRADLGLMISASHNPFEDNGIKFFDSNGYKLDEASEQWIEAHIHSHIETPGVQPIDMGRAKRLEDGGGRYLEFIKTQFPRKMRLDGLKIALDCAHGATYKIAPRVLWELGAEVVCIGDTPNGININAHCGATYPNALCEAVRVNKADLGIALDGDGDRLIMADETGKILDGDHLIAYIASAWHAKKTLLGSGIVGTVLSNLGLEHFMTSRGLTLFRSPVGDKHVLEVMQKRGCNLGGEQSGHLIFSDFSTTGDGLLAAIHILSILVSNTHQASYIGRLFQKIPQKTLNIQKNQFNLTHRSIQDWICHTESKLMGIGRLLIRESGTEPIIRIMVECEDARQLQETLDECATLIKTQY